MELPTTNNVKALEAFQDLFNTHIRPVAAYERQKMSLVDKDKFRDADPLLVPASIILDIMVYMTHHLSEFATEEAFQAQSTGDMSSMVDQCSKHDPYWKASRAMALAVNVFGQDPVHGSDYIGGDEHE